MQEPPTLFTLNDHDQAFCDGLRAAEEILKIMVEQFKRDDLSRHALVMSIRAMRQRVRQVELREAEETGQSAEVLSRLAVERAVAASQ